MEAAGTLAARPQRRHRGSPDCSPTDHGNAFPFRVGARQWCQAGRVVRDHLAFYSGWAHAMSAVPVAKEIFRQRGMGQDQLPPAQEKLLPLHEAAEKQRSEQVSNNFGAVSPGLVQNTTDLLFRELWLRPALTPRDRSLVTVSALIAAGQVGQITYHLNRAMDNGLTQTQASEVLTHIAFYAGWPCAFSALPVVKEVFTKRPQ